MSKYIELKRVIVGRLGVSEDEIHESTSFKDDLGADSLDIVELIMEIEDTFGIEVSDSEAENIQTVGDVLNCIDEKLKKYY